MLDDCLGPAAAGLHRQLLAGRGHAGDRPDRQARQPARHLHHRAPLPQPRFLRFQLAALAEDPECRRAELIFVLDSPEQRAEAEHLLRGLYAVHALPITLVVMPENLGYAAANNAGAAPGARGRLLLLLNSDVVPSRPGWLAQLRAELERPEIGAVGPKLLFDDESMQHAGLYSEQDLDGIWFNAHYHKGMPRLWPAAQRRRFVPGVTGAAMMTTAPCSNRSAASARTTSSATTRTPISACACTRSAPRTATFRKPNYSISSAVRSASTKATLAPSPADTIVGCTTGAGTRDRRADGTAGRSVARLADDDVRHPARPPQPQPVHAGAAAEAPCSAATATSAPSARSSSSAWSAMPTSSPAIGCSTSAAASAASPCRSRNTSIQPAPTTASIPSPPASNGARRTITPVYPNMRFHHLDLRHPLYNPNG